MTGFEWTVYSAEHFGELAVELATRPQSGPDGWHKSVSVKQQLESIYCAANLAAHYGFLLLNEGALTVNVL